MVGPKFETYGDKIFGNKTKKNAFNDNHMLLKNDEHKILHTFDAMKTDFARLVYPTDNDIAPLLTHINTTASALTKS